MKPLDPQKLGKNHDFTKRVNRANVLRLMRQGDGVSRAVLARETGLSIQSLSNIVAELEDSRLIVAQKRIYGAKGQPPVPYRVNPDAGYCIGISLDEGRLRAVASDFSHARRAQIVREHDISDPDSVLDLLCDVVAEMQRQVALPLWGVGLATPQLFDPDVADIGQLEASIWVELGNSRLAHRLSQHLGRPVFIENDANAGALGELVFGAGQTLTHFCYLHVSRGLGLGIVQEARVFHGAGGNAGEIGRFRLSPARDARAVEDVLSLEGLAAAGPGPSEIDAWVAEAADVLRWLVGIVERAYDPQTIVLGGELDPGLADRLIEAAAPLQITASDRLARRSARLQRSPLATASAALGASVMPFLAISDPDPDRMWRYEGTLPDLYTG